MKTRTQTLVAVVLLLFGLGIYGCSNKPADDMKGMDHSGANGDMKDMKDMPGMDHSKK